MPQVDFYHLTKSDMDEALVMLVKKSQLAGKKVLVQCPRPAAEAMDEALWTQDPESWIPHGLDDADGASHAHAWIMSVPEGNPISAEFLFLLHGAERPDMTSFKRVFTADRTPSSPRPVPNGRNGARTKPSRCVISHRMTKENGRNEADQPVRVAIDPFLCRMLACLDLVTCRRRPY